MLNNTLTRKSKSFLIKKEKKEISKKSKERLTLPLI
jgi:hypothetical protein